MSETAVDREELLQRVAEVRSVACERTEAHADEGV